MSKNHADKRANKIIYKTVSNEHIWSEVEPDVFETNHYKSGNNHERVPYLTIANGGITRTMKNRFGVTSGVTQVDISTEKMAELLILVKQKIKERDLTDERDRLRDIEEQKQLELANRRGENGRFLDHETPLRTTKFLESKTIARLQAMNKTASRYNVNDLYSPEKGVTVTVAEIKSEIKRRTEGSRIYVK